MQTVLLRFPPSNRIRYSQDFQRKVGVPSDVDFEILSISDTGASLVAPGYGKQGNYGEGRVYVYWQTERASEQEDMDKIEHWLATQFWRYIQVPKDEGNIDGLTYNAIHLLRGGPDYKSCDDVSWPTVGRYMDALRVKYGLPRAWDPVVEAMREHGLALNVFHLSDYADPPFPHKAKCVIMRVAANGEEVVEFATWHHGKWQELGDNQASTVIAWMVPDVWSVEHGDSNTESEETDGGND